MCTARCGNKSFERYNLLSKRALFVPRILSTCPLHLSPATLMLNFFLHFSLYHSLLPVFFPHTLLPFHSDTLHAVCVPYDKRPSQGQSRAISLHLIRFPLIRRPLSQQRTHVYGCAGCLLGFVCSRLFIYSSGQTELMEKRTGPITASAWANRPACQQLCERWPIPGWVWNPASIYVINCCDQFSFRQVFFYRLPLRNISNLKKCEQVTNHD